MPNFESDGLTFDSSGNFWGTFCRDAAGDTTGGLIFELTQAQLQKLNHGGSVKPKVEFENPDGSLFDCPSALEFDKSGNLWVANSGASNLNPSIMKYAANQLTSGGKVSPAVVFTSPDILQIYDIRFDGSGDLWLAADGVPGGISAGEYEFTSEQLSETGSQPVVVTPNLALPFQPGDLPAAIAFDQGGNLWVGGFATSLLSFAASDLSGSGTISPVPMVTIDPATLKHGYSSFSQPNGLAFDGQGSLWVACVEGNGGKKQSFGNVSEFKADQIATSGSPQPSLFLQGNSITKNPYRITFGPQL
jgi:secreted PhoX family phosphatase